jgi:hypothetical protein
MYSREMKRTAPIFALHRVCAFAFAGALIFLARPASAQVSPAEILNPELKAAETKYLPQLKELNREIAAMKFPFSFVLSRYVGLDPARQAEADSRGLEFVRFHDRVVMKVTGNYNAAYNADLLTQNERAGRTFQDVVAPILRLLTQKIPPDVACDGIGFEISHHARTPNKNYDYEGKEILVVVFDKADAYGFPQTADASQQQEILNRSEIYLNGSDFGLVPGAKDPLNVEALARSNSRKAPEASPASASVAASRLAVESPNLMPSATRSGTAAPVTPGVPASAGGAAPPVNSGDAAAPRAAAPAQADVDSLQTKYQSQLDVLAKEGAAKFHFVEYAPPSFAIFQKQIVLQMTLRNPLRFDAEKSSIYKRAAQSFDLFLAPRLKELLDKTPAGAEFDAFDFSVLNQLSPEPHASSEAIEFICPRKAALQFANAEITNQQLIDQSIVLVNGVRVALNLQLVE